MRPIINVAGRFECCLCMLVAPPLVVSVDSGSERLPAFGVLEVVRRLVICEDAGPRLGWKPAITRSRTDGRGRGSTGSELARADMQTRRAASEGFRQLLDIIARRNRLKGSLSAKDDGIFTLSTMVGAVTLARILDDSELSERILAVARKRLASRPGKAQSKRPKSMVQ
jgi:hypothetical protein